MVMVIILEVIQNRADIAKTLENLTNEKNTLVDGAIIGRSPATIGDLDWSYYRRLQDVHSHI